MHKKCGKDTKMDTKLLIVDDDPNICDMLKLYFENEGYQVKTAADGVDGVNFFKIYEPDIVLLDIMMPKKDGWQVCREIREISPKPVIMITAKGEKTPLFDTVQTVNGRLNAMKGVFLNYDSKGVIFCNYKGMSNALSKAKCTSELESYRSLTAVSCNQRDKFAVGCFENADGAVGYYVVNLNYKGAGTLDMTFDSAVDYRVWSGEGLSDMGTTAALELKLEAGEGVFIQVSPANIDP